MQIRQWGAIGRMTDCNGLIGIPQNFRFPSTIPLGKEMKSKLENYVRRMFSTVFDWLLISTNLVYNVLGVLSA